MPLGPHLAVWRRVHGSPHATVQMVLSKVHTTHPPNQPTIHNSARQSPSHTRDPPPLPVQARHAYLEVGLTKPSPSRHDTSVAVLQSAAAARSSPVSEPMLARLREAFRAGRGEAQDSAHRA